MTGRVCPVHGEYSATGVCRWCDVRSKAMAGDREAMREAMQPGAIAFVGDMRRAVGWPVKSVTAKELVEEFGEPGEDAIAVHWTLDFTPQICPEALMAAHVAELAAQHAALRWERVARRWGSKHPTMLDLAKGWGLFVVEAMREHIEKLARSNPLLEDKPGEPKP